MGQCMSRKAAGAFAASAAAAHSKPSAKMHNKHGHRPADESPGDEEKNVAKTKSSYTKGVSTSFGFKRRPTTAPSIASNSNAARRLANPDIIDRNGNGHADTEPLTSNAAPTGRSTPRLMPPKKEANATRLNRFGFRQPQLNRLHKVSDLNNSPPGEMCNNNVKISAPPPPRILPVTDNNKNRMAPAAGRPKAEKFMLQSTQLPRPEPVRLIETKTAKTLANNSRKIATNSYLEDNSSKDGSLTEDSGVGSQNGGDPPAVDRLNYSPTYGARRSFHKSRNLEIVMSGNTFDLRDLDESSENCVPLPELPSAFTTHASPDNIRGVYNVGFVRERALEYQQRHLDGDNRRKISITSSEGFSDDYGDEEKTYRDKYKTEKSFIKPNAHKSFLKTKPDTKHDSSPPSSDEHEWGLGGEAMADEVSFISMSSSDESKDREQHQQTDNMATALQTLMDASLSNTFPKPDIKNALLIIEDPKFAAVAVAASNTSLLLDDETSPVDSLFSCSESDEILKRKIARSSSNSKDINEKLTPPSPGSPGTPTNASNSLSLSDGKDDFLIDDEIADQPALVFEAAGGNDAFSMSHSLSQNNSESATIIVESTPKPKRRPPLGFEGSPLSLRKKKLFHSRAGSLDTLSPCESIASDDLMMDYDYSQSSGLEDLERHDQHSHGFSSLDDAILRKPEIEENGAGAGLRDWSSLLGNYATEKPLRGNATKTSRLLWSRTGTPNSIPDSPKSVDNSKSTTTTNKSRHSIGSSPLRLARPSATLSSSGGGYDSDDSVRLDRANHSAMKQDIISIKTMLLKLRRILNESETHIPFDGQLTLANGLFNGAATTTTITSAPSSSAEDRDAQNDEVIDNRLELAELRRQVLFLQGQLEDKEKTVHCLQEQVIRISTENYISNSAPASTVAAASSASEVNTCNAATQTERIRPISAGPSLLNGSPTDGAIGSLVSASSESPQQRRSRPPLPQQPDSPSSSSSSSSPLAAAKKMSTAKLWRQPGEPPSPQRFTSTSNHSSSSSSSSIPRRANSRTRTPSSVPS